METSMLAAGPLKSVIAHLPLGSYEVLAEVYEEAGAFTTYQIKPNLDLLMPDKIDYDEFMVKNKIEQAKLLGDKNMVNQLLMADVSDNNQTQ